MKKIIAIMAACMLTIGASAQRTCVQDWSRTGNYNSNCAATSSLGTLDNSTFKLIQNGVTVMTFSNSQIAPQAVISGTAQVAVVQATTTVINFASTASLSASSAVTVSIPNAALGDKVVITAGAGTYSDGAILVGSFNAYVSSAGVVTTYFVNSSNATKDPAESTFSIALFKN